MADTRPERGAGARIKATHVLSLMGFSSYLIWELLGIFGSLSFLQPGFGSEELLFLRAISFFVLAASFFIPLPLALRLRKHIRALFRFGVIMTALVIGGGTITVFQGPLPFALALTLWCAYALSLTSMMIVWAFYFSASYDEMTPTVMTVAYTIGFVVFLLASMMIDNVHSTIYLLVAVLSAATSIGMLAFLSLVSASPDQTTSLEDGDCIPPTRTEVPKTPRASIPRFIHSATYGISYGFAITLLQTLGPISASIGTASGLLGCLIGLFALKHRNDGERTDIRRSTFIPVIIGLLLFALHPPLTYILCSVPIIGASIVTAIISWVSTAQSTSQSDIDPIWSFCKTKFPGWLGFFVGTVVSIVVMFSPPQAAAVTIAVLACLVCVFFAIVEFRTYDTADAKRCLDDKGQDITDGEGEEAYQERSFYLRGEMLARDKGLSEREKEVFRLLAKGRNAEFISNELCIARPTAKTHIQHIYQKLCINSHQELIDMVESYALEPQRR